MEIKIANYGQEREIDATNGEFEIFDIIQDISERQDLRLVRKSKDYVTAAIGEWDLARFKYTDRAKWIVFPLISNEKIRISFPTTVAEHTDELTQSLAVIEKYS